MNFSGAVIISLLLYHRVLSSEGSFLKEKVLLEEESLLEKFFAETKLFLDEDNTRHVTVVGESDDQLRQTRPLLDAFPYFIGSDVAMFCGSREFTPDTSIVYFLTSLDRKYLKKVGRSLSLCKKNRMYFIIEGSTVREVDLARILRRAFEKTAKLPVYVHHTKKFLKFYGYKMTANCSGTAELLVDWKAGVDTKRLKDWLDHFSFEGCPLPVGTIHHPPSMNLAKDVNGTVRIIGGSEGEMVSTIAQKMNFTPLVQNFEASNNTITPKSLAILESCAARNISIGVGEIRPTKRIYETLDTSQSYSQECVVWVMPKHRPWQMNLMTSEFSLKSWLLIALAFLVSFGIDKVVRSTRHLRRGNNRNSKSCNIILDLIGLTLGNPIVYQPISIGGKLLLIMYLLYSTVITTAYKTSLSSKLTVERRIKSIAEPIGIIDTNIIPGGDMSKLGILREQMDADDVVPKLIKRYVIEKNVSKALRRVSDGRFAYLTTISELTYHLRLLEKDGVRVSFDMPDRCVLTYENVFVFPKSTHLTKPTNKVMERLREAGLIEYWIKRNFKLNRADSISAEVSEMMNTPEEFHILNQRKLYYIFYVYCIALSFCILVFVGELLVHKYKVADGRTRFKHSNRYRTRRRVHFKPKSRRSNYSICTSQ